MTTAKSAIGKAAEDRACRALEEAGYRIVGRNVRKARCEIDVVAYDGEVLCFIEVRSKAYARFGRAIETVNLKKQQRIVRGALAYLADLGARAPVCRFDIVAIDGEGDSASLAIVKSAFEAQP